MRHRGWLLLLIVIAGLGVRIAYLAADPHGVRAETIDGEIARNIVAGRGLVINENATRYVFSLYQREHRQIDPASVDYASLDRHPLWRPEIVEPVGAAVLLAGLWEITGSEHYLQLQIVQILIDALMALLVYRIAMRLFERPGAAVLAAVLYILYPPIAWQSTLPSLDIWAVDFTIAILALYLEAISAPRPWRWLLACGMTAGVAAYFRPTLLVLPAALALVTLPGIGWRDALRRGFLTTMVAAVFLIPWVIRNYNEFHVFIPLRGGLGETLWDGLGESHNNFGATENLYTTAAEVKRLHPELVYESPAWDSLLTHWSVDAIKRHPGYYLAGVARRTARSTFLLYDSGWMHRGTKLPFTYPAGSGSGSLALRARGGSSLLGFVVDHPLDTAQDALQSLVFLLAMLALGLSWRGRRRRHAVMLMVLLLALAPYLLIHVEPRYLLPTAVLYMIWVGLGLDLLVSRVRSRSSRRVPAEAVPALLVRSPEESLRDR